MSKKIIAGAAPLKKSQSNPGLSDSQQKPPVVKKTSGLSVFKNLSISDNKDTNNVSEGISNGNVQNKISTEDAIIKNKADEAFIQFLSLQDEPDRIEKIKFYLNDSIVSSTMHKGHDINAIIITKIVEKYGTLSKEGSTVINFIERLNSSSEQHIREFTMILIQHLLLRLGRIMEPIVLSMFSLILSFHADRSQIVRDCSSNIGNNLMQIMCPHSFRKLFPLLMGAIKAEEDWRVKVGSLTLLKAIAPRVSVQLTPLLPELIPKASECILDSKKQVQVAGLDTLTEACGMIANDG